MLRTIDIAWLAGLLEGEGSFGVKDGSPKIQMQSTDEDIIRRASELFGVAFREKPYKPRGKDYYKPVWGVHVHGTRAIGWMMTVYSLMGERRQEKIRSVIDAWKASKATPRGSRGMRLMATCHPEKTRTGGGLCKACYMRKWRSESGRNGTYYRHMKAEAA